jgi:hypothetical protein
MARAVLRLMPSCAAISGSDGKVSSARNTVTYLLYASLKTVFCLAIPHPAFALHDMRQSSAVADLVVP